MYPTPIRRSASPFAQKTAYKSPYGPKYHFQPNVAGITMKDLTRFGFRAAPMGGVALFAVIFYASGIPRIKKDILQKIPFISGYYVDEIHPADNPF